MKKQMMNEYPGTPLPTKWRKLDPTLIDYVSAVNILQKAATGEKVHLNQGLCPDVIEGHDSRDSDCEICWALITIDEHK